jgi:hypothetical protein
VDAGKHPETLLWRVWCKKCYAVVEYDADWDRERVVDAWNHRAPLKRWGQGAGTPPDGLYLDLEEGQVDEIKGGVVYDYPPNEQGYSETWGPYEPDKGWALFGPLPPLEEEPNK